MNPIIFFAHISLRLTMIETLGQVIFCGVLLVLMAVGNFANTVQTLMVKSRFKAKMRRSKSKQRLN